MKAFTNFIFDSLMKLTEAQRFEVWRKARDRYCELRRMNKDAKHAELLYRVASTAMLWNS